ncbi:Arsb, partial [Symbiodinium sp. KB8]
RFDGKTGNNSARQSVCALASALDDAVGEVIHTLKEKGLYEDTLIIFASDNGGPTNGEEGSWSSNYPLRGGKNSLWEGGTRVAAAIRGPGIPPELVGTVSYHKVHAADWLPTLVRIAADDSTWLERNWPRGEPRLMLGDGIDVWDTFSKGLEVRTEVLLEAHPDHHWQAHGNALIVGDWKILRFGANALNPKVEFGWVPPPGQKAASVDYQIACKLEEEPGEDLSSGTLPGWRWHGASNWARKEGLRTDLDLRLRD